MEDTLCGVAAPRVEVLEAEDEEGELAEGEEAAEGGEGAEKPEGETESSEKS